MYNPSTNPKWREAGRKLNRKQYRDMDEDELREKKRVAEEWLKANPNHPKYEEALKRYEKIENEIFTLSGDWLK